MCWETQSTKEPYEPFKYIVNAKNKSGKINKTLLCIHSILLQRCNIPSPRSLSYFIFFHFIKFLFFTQQSPTGYKELTFHMESYV